MSVTRENARLRLEAGLPPPPPGGSGPSSASKEIHILLLEDNARDADLIRRTLRQAGLVFSLQHVDSKAAFVHNLEATPPDLILSDFSLPALDGYVALALAREDVPMSLSSSSPGRSARKWPSKRSRTAPRTMC